MSLQTVRTIVANYFGGTPTESTDSAGQPWNVYRSPNMPGVATLFVAQPSEDNQQDYFQGLPEGTRVGVKAFLQMGRKSSVRRAMGGDHDGIRANVYQVLLRVYGLSALPHGDMAQLDFDDVLDGIEAFLYEDRSMGTVNSDTGYVLDAGEGPGGLTISPEATNAMLPDGRFYLYATVTFNVREWIHG